MKFDCNCFTGNWPFFRVRCNTLEKLAAKHRLCGIEGGFISALESIFYQDPYEAEVLLAEAVKGTPYRHAMILNPTLPGWRDDLARGVEKLNIHAVRLVHGFHGYRLTDPVLDDVIALLRHYRLPLILTIRMRDERCMYMIQPQNTPVGDIAEFLDKSRDIVTLLTHIRSSEAEALSGLFSDRDNLFTDISGFKDGLFVIEKLQQNDALRGHMVYGSGAPLMDMHATTLLLDTTEISEAEKKEIDSAKRLLSLMK